MKKRELVYLHSLLVEIRRYLAARGDLPADAFAAYDEFGVAPTAVYETKSEHREAVMRLLDGLTTALETREARQDGTDELSADA